MHAFRGAFQPNRFDRSLHHLWKVCISKVLLFKKVQTNRDEMETQTKVASTPAGKERETSLWRKDPMTNLSSYLSAGGGLRETHLPTPSNQDRRREEEIHHQEI